MLLRGANLSGRRLAKTFKIGAGLGLSGLCGYGYGKFELTPFDYPEMAMRSARLVHAIGSIIYDFKYKLPKDRTKGEMSLFHQRTAERLFAMCCANRGTYIKVGQHVGAMEYLLPPEYIQVFKELHSSAPPSTEAEVRSVVRDELGGEIEDFFTEWDWSPLGAASLAQCHKARLKSTGRIVAVKVQHAPVKHTAHLDMMLMEFGVIQAGQLIPDFKLAWLARTTRRNLPRELDFLHEAENAEKVRLHLKDLDFVKVPKIEYSLSTSRLLVMDYMPGTQINDKKELNRRNIDVNATIERVTDMYSEMIFKNGFIHCDPHPGNILINEGPEIVLLDHGLYQTINDEFRYHYALLWRSLINGDLSNIRVAARYLNVEDMFPLLSAMVSGRSWQSVKQGLGKTKSMSKTEEEIIQEEISYWINEMSTVLENVPKEMILIFKTNDLLRGLESTLGCRSDANSFITMSKHCLRCMYNFDKINNELTWSKWREYQTMQWAVFFYKLYLRFTAGAVMQDVPEIEIASKEVRMVDWHASMDKTAHV